MKKKDLAVIGYACGIGGENTDCEFGPASLKNSQYLKHLGIHLNWLRLIAPKERARKLAALPVITNLAEEVAGEIFNLVRNGQRFLVIGGDHTAAIGTWKGAAKAIKHDGKLGLLWIDAHLDSHTPKTSWTKNVHGMPVAVLLGYPEKSDDHLHVSEASILPANICLVGIRSFEPEERAFLENLNVKIVDMEEIDRKGIRTALTEAIAYIKKDTVGYGVSLDLDAIDPFDAPAVGCPVVGGITGNELVEALHLVKNDAKFLGAEIVEFNPLLDQSQRTEQLIAQLISAMF